MIKSSYQSNIKSKQLDEVERLSKINIKKYGNIMNDNDYLSYLSFLFPILFFIMWALVCKLLSFFGGWNSFAQVYQLQNKFNGTKWYMQSGRLGWANYNSVLTVGVSREFLFLGVFILFRIGHPNLAIRFSEVKGKEKKGIIFTYINITFERVPGKTLRIMRSLGDKIEKESNGLWKYERQ